MGKMILVRPKNADSAGFDETLKLFVDIYGEDFQVIEASEESEASLKKSLENRISIIEKQLIEQSNRLDALFK